MPHDKTNPQDNALVGALLRRPTPMPEGPRQPLPEVPYKDEDPATRFMGGFAGLDEPGGGIAGLLGATAGMISPMDDIMGFLRKLRPGKAAIKAVEPEAPFKGPLPQWTDAIGSDGRLKPEIAAESARLMAEMIDDPTYKAAFQEFAKRDPLGAGHVQSLTFGKNPDEPFLHNLLTGGAQNSVAIRQIQGFPEAEFQSKLRVNPNALPNLLSKRQRANTMGHELQHASQAVREGNKQFDKNYEKFIEMFGYNKNPYEDEARKVGEAISKIVRLNKRSGK